MRNMEINLYDMFDTDTLRDRQTALFVAERICEMPPEISVTINFEKIIFASRSFCHELLMNIEDRKDVNFTNANEVIMKMMIAVLKKPNLGLHTPMKVKVIS